MMTNAQLLELMLREYHNNSVISQLRGDSPVIREAAEYFRGLEATGRVTTDVLDKLFTMFRPLLAQWDISKKPSATLKVLPTLMNAILKSLTILEGFAPNLSLMDVYKKEWYQTYTIMTADEYKNMLASTASEQPISSDQTLYLYYSSKHKGQSSGVFIAAKTPEEKIIRELSIKLSDSISIREKIQECKRSDERLLVLNDQERELIMKETSKKGYFLPSNCHDEKYLAELLLTSVGMSLLFPFISDNHLSVVKRLIALKIENKLSLLEDILKYVEDILKYVHIEKETKILDSYLEICTKGLLTKQNEARIKACIAKICSDSLFFDRERIDQIQRGIDDVLSLVKLEKLTDVQKTRIESCNDPEEARSILHALNHLAEKKILDDQPTFEKIETIITGAYSLSNSHNKYKFPMAIANGFIILQQANALTLENIEIIGEQANNLKEQWSVLHVAWMLSYLKKLNRQTSADLSKYVRPEFIEGYVAEDLYPLLNLIDRRNLLAENFDFILNYSVVFYEVRLFSALRRLPEHMLTQAVLNEISLLIIRYTNGQYARSNVEQAIDEYISQLIDQPAAVPAVNTHEWGPRQTVHTLSIELSSTLALLSLEKRYHLTPVDIARCIDELRLFADTIHTERFAHLDTDNLSEKIRDTAKRCLTRLINRTLTQNSQEESTHFAFDKILALVWTGLKDAESHRPDTDLDPMENFIRELRNIQVIYGVSAEGVELASCFDGTIKGLLNSINGIHPDVNLDLINRDTVYSLMQLHAKTIFWQSFCEKIREPGFLEKFNREVEESDWKDSELQQWYEACVQSTAQVVEQECLSRMQQTGLDKEQIDEFMKKWVQELWIPAGKVGISDGKPMLDDFDASRALANFTADEINLLLSTIPNTVLKNRIQGLIRHDNETYVFTTNSENKPKYKNEFFTQTDIQQIQSVLTKLGERGNALKTKLILKKRYEEMVESIHISDSISHPLYQQCSQRFPELLEPIRFILDFDNFGNEPLRNNALVRMRNWIEEDDFKLDNAKHRLIVAHFFKIYHLEKTLLQHKDKLIGAGFLSEKNFSIITRGVLDYYSSIAHSTGVNIAADALPVIQRLTALEDMMQPWLNDDSFNRIKDFFALWFNVEDTQRQPLYAFLCDKALRQRTEVVVRNFISDTDLKGIHVRDITPYQINCIFLYAMLHEPKQWKRTFAFLLDKVLTYIEKIDPNDTNAQQLKRDSYPPALIGQLRYLLQSRQWQLEQANGPTAKPVRPNDLLLLPHQVRTIDEWVTVAGRLSEAERDSTYHQLATTLEPRFILDLKINNGLERDLEPFLRIIPQDRRTSFQERVQQMKTVEVIPSELRSDVNIEVDVTTALSLGPTTREEHNENDIPVTHQIAAATTLITSPVDVSVHTLTNANHSSTTAVNTHHSEHSAVEIFRPARLIDAKLQELQQIVNDATTEYINWSQAKNSDLDGPRGFYGRFTSSRHTEKGVARAQLLQGDVRRAQTAEEAQDYINQFLNDYNRFGGKYNTHSCASFLLEKLVELENSPWAGLKSTVTTRPST